MTPPKYAIATPFEELVRLDLFDEDKRFIRHIAINRGSFGINPENQTFYEINDFRYTEINSGKKSELIERLRKSQEEAINENLRAHQIRITAHHPVYGSLDIHPNETEMEEALLLNFLRRQYKKETLQGVKPTEEPVKIDLKRSLE